MGTGIAIIITSVREPESANPFSKARKLKHEFWEAAFHQVEV